MNSMTTVRASFEILDDSWRVFGIVLMYSTSYDILDIVKHFRNNLLGILRILLRFVRILVRILLIKFSRFLSNSCRES